MKGRRGVGLIAGLAAALSLASATSLGTFPDLVASGVALEVEPCAAGSVELQDPLGAAVDLVLGGTTAAVGLGGLTGDCDGSVPTIIVVGHPILDPLTEQVLVVQTLSPIAPSGGTAAPSVGAGTALADVADGLNLISEVRVAFSSS